MRLTDRVDALARRDETNDGGKDYLCPCGAAEGQLASLPQLPPHLPADGGFDRHRTGSSENRATGQANSADA